MIRLGLASTTAAFSLYSWYYCWKISERKHKQGRRDDEAMLVIAGIIFLIAAELAIIYGVLQ